MVLDTKTSASITASKLRELILGGQFPPGSPLRQEMLSDRLGVSRTPLRQALQILSEEGLVEVSGFKGARVVEVSRERINDLFAMRCALEPIAFESASTEINKIDLAAAEMALDSSESETNPARLAELNWEFHEALYAPSKRLFLLENIRRLNITSSFAEAIARSIEIRAHDSHSEHLAILQACKSKDWADAKDLLTEHLMAAHNALLATLRD